MNFDKNLSLNSHINAKCKSASYGVVRFMKYLSITSAKSMATVLSHLDYGNTLYAALPDDYIKPIERVQHYSAKVIMNKHRKDSVTEAMKALHWLLIRWRCQYKTAVLTYKAIHGDAPMYVQDMLQLKHYQRNTRSRQSTSSQGTTELLVPFNKMSCFGFRPFGTS